MNLVERTASSVSSEGAAGPEETSLSELIQRSRNATGAERAKLCTRVNRAALSSADDKERRAALLLEMLDDEALHELEDEHGVHCRAVAVEAVLAIGYPWALQLDPDDVQFLREHPIVSRRKQPPAPRVVGGIAGLWAAAMVLKSPLSSGLLSTRGVDVGLAAALALIVLSAIPVMLGRPWLSAARWTMGLAGLTLLLPIFQRAGFSGLEGTFIFAVAPTLALLGALWPRGKP
jgi:hypothetical protein